MFTTIQNVLCNRELIIHHQRQLTGLITTVVLL